MPHETWKYGQKTMENPIKSNSLLDCGSHRMKKKKRTRWTEESNLITKQVMTSTFPRVCWVLKLSPRTQQGASVLKINGAPATAVKQVTTDTLSVQYSSLRHPESVFHSLIRLRGAIIASAQGTRY
jgi:hypothetical protein